MSDYTIQVVTQQQETINIVPQPIINLGFKEYISTGTSNHESLQGLQGGSTNQHNHLTNAELTSLHNQSGTNTGDQDLSGKANVSDLVAHTSNTFNPHLVTKQQVNLANVPNLDTSTTANIIDSTNKRFITDAEKTILDNQSGVNTGDETTSTIKTKLSITTLSGSNTGDQDISGLATNTNLALKVDKITGKGLSTNDYTTAEKTVVSNQSNTNTGDETVSTIKTKLGITTLSGSNTGDQDLSALVVNTRQINSHALNADIVLVKADIGLSNVDNTSDVNKPISTLTQTALNAKQNSLGFTPENITNKNANNGYAGLDSSGLVPASLLPSYVDDVAEYANLAAFPVNGSQIVIYVAKDTGKIYRWSGTAYIEISASPGSTDSVSEGSTNLYFTFTRVLNTLLTGLSLATSTVISATDSVLTSLGKLQAQISSNLTTITNHIANVSNPHSTTQSQVGLSNVVNLDTSTTANITDSTNKRFITDANKTVLNNTSGINTGDQVISNLVVNTTTVNGHALSSNVTVTKSDVGLGNVPNLDTSTTSNITDSTDKRLITDAQRTVLTNTSNTNTGDETLATIKSKLGITTLTGSNTGDQTSISGNSGTATALQTARNIDGIAFDGTANITVIAPASHSATSKVTPINADEIPLIDSANSNVLAKLTWSNLKATIKTYFDTLYQNALGFTPENSANKNAVSGYAGLDTNSKVALTNLYQSSTSQSGYLSSTDWNTFNGKQAALGFTPENSANKNTVSGYAGLDTNSKVALTNLYQSSTSQSGYLSSTDWNTFNGKQAALGFTAENVTNKSTDGTLIANSDTNYPSQKAVKTYADTKQTAFVSQVQNLHYASPSGSSGLPSFRSLTTADLPDDAAFFGTKYQSGTWYQSPWQVSNGTNALISNNTIYAFPFICIEDHTFTGLGIRVTTGVAASLIRLFIFNDTNGLPDTVFFDPQTTVSGATTSSDASYLSQSIALKKGKIYWFGVATDTNNVGLLFNGVSTTIPIMGGNNLAGAYGRIQKTWTFSASTGVGVFGTGTFQTNGGGNIKVLA